MGALSLQNGLLTLIIVGILAANVKGDCSCAANECCSKYDFCGTTAEYCGEGCKSGPSNTTTNDVSVPDIVTEVFFNGILNQAQGDCPGKSFYTRAAFLDVLNSYNQFAKSGSSDDGKCEIAAFFAHVTHETGSKFLIPSLTLLLYNYLETYIILISNYGCRLFNR